MKRQPLDNNETISVLVESTGEGHEGFPFILIPRSEDRDEMRLTDDQARVLYLELHARYGRTDILNRQRQVIEIKHLNPEYSSIPWHVHPECYVAPRGSLETAAAIMQDPQGRAIHVPGAGLSIRAISPLNVPTQTMCFSCSGPVSEPPVECDLFWEEMPQQ